MENTEKINNGDLELYRFEKCRIVLLRKLFSLNIYLLSH